MGIITDNINSVPQPQKWIFWRRAECEVSSTWHIKFTYYLFVLFVSSTSGNTSFSLSLCLFSLLLFESLSFFSLFRSFLQEALLLCFFFVAVFLCFNFQVLPYLLPQHFSNFSIDSFLPEMQWNLEFQREIHSISQHVFYIICGCEM